MLVLHEPNFGDTGNEFLFVSGLRLDNILPLTACLKHEVLYDMK